MGDMEESYNTKSSKKPVTPLVFPVAKMPKRVIRRKRRKPVMDSEKLIPASQYKDQLTNTCDILGTFDIAPRSKRAMYHASYESIGKFFSTPGRNIPSPAISQLFQRCLTLRVELQAGQEVDADGFLAPLDPELRVANNVVMFAEEQSTEWDKPYSTTRKAESFDRLVQGMCKHRYKTQTLRQKRQNIKSHQITVPTPVGNDESAPQNIKNELVVEDTSVTFEPGGDVEQNIKREEPPVPDQSEDYEALSQVIFTTVDEDDLGQGTSTEVSAKTEPFSEYFVVTSDDGLEYCEDLESDLGQGDVEANGDTFTDVKVSVDTVSNEILPVTEPSEAFLPRLELNLKNNCNQFEDTEDQIYLEAQQEGDSEITFQVNGQDSHEGLLYYTANACTSEVMFIENDVNEISDTSSPVQFYVYMP